MSPTTPDPPAVHTSPVPRSTVSDRSVDVSDVVPSWTLSAEAKCPVICFAVTSAVVVRVEDASE